MKNKKALTSYLLVILVYALITILNKTGSLSSTMNALLVPTVAYIVAALALNLLVDYLGDLCLGQAGFMAVGAFSGIVCAACLLRNNIPDTYFNHCRRLDFFYFWFNYWYSSTKT